MTPDQRDERERALIEMRARGITWREITKRLGVSEPTARTHYNRARYPLIIPAHLRPIPGFPGYFVDCERAQVFSIWRGSLRLRKVQWLRDRWAQVALFRNGETHWRQVRSIIAEVRRREGK